MYAPDASFFDEKKMVSSRLTSLNMGMASAYLPAWYRSTPMAYRESERSDCPYAVKGIADRISISMKKYRDMRKVLQQEYKKAAMMIG